MLHKLGLSRSGYYDYLKRKPSHQEKRRHDVKKAILQIYEDSHENYGAPKIAKILNSGGISITERTVGVYMRQMGIRAQWVKPHTQTTIRSDFSGNLKNLLDRNFSPAHPNCVWCTDITYIHTKLDGFVYLACIMDLYSRRIISWKLTKTLDTGPILKSIEEARKRRPSQEPIMIHTDRGIHYTCDLYRKLTRGMIRSYSAKGVPYDNACIESFHSLIKREWLSRFDIQNYRHAYRLVSQYIDDWYNPERIHSHCGYMSPAEYEVMYQRTSTD